MGVYNEERFVRDAVRSILNQTYKDFEFLIVDDGSSDNTLSILESFKDSRVKIVSEGKLGRVQSLNKGFSMASGDLIFMMDGDDISLPNRFRLQLKEFDRLGGPDVLGTFNQVISESGVILGNNYAPVDHDDIIAAQLVLGTSITHGAALYKRESVLRHGGYDPYFINSQDVDLFLRMSFDCRFANLPKILFQYRKHAQSATGKLRYISNERKGLIWWTAVALQRYHLIKDGFGEFWDDTNARETLFTMLEERLENSLYVKQMVFTREWQIAKADMSVQGRRLQGIVRALRAVRYPDALITRVIRRLTKRGVITPPKYVTAKELREALRHGDSTAHLKK